MGLNEIRLAGVLFAMAFLPLFVTGCLTPVKNEIPLATGSVMEKPEQPTDTRLVIFNDSGFLAYGLDGSGRMNVSLNGRGLGQIRIGQYAQVIVPQGQYTVNLTHYDTGTFTSEHQIELNHPISYLEIFATPTANKAFLVSHLPPNFEQQFKPVSPKR